MTIYRLRLCEDHVSAGAEYLTIPAKLNCILYVVSGEIVVKRQTTASTAESEKAVFAGGPCKAQASPVYFDLNY